MKLLIFLCRFVYLFCILYPSHTLTMTHFNTFIFHSHIILKEHHMHTDTQSFLRLLFCFLTMVINIVEPPSNLCPVDISSIILTSRSSHDGFDSYDICH